MIASRRSAIGSRRGRGTWRFGRTVTWSGWERTQPGEGLSLRLREAAIVPFGEVAQAGGRLVQPRGHLSAFADPGAALRRGTGRNRLPEQLLSDHEEVVEPFPERLTVHRCGVPVLDETVACAKADPECEREAEQDRQT